MGQTLAGQASRVWADEVTVHVLIAGKLIKTAASSLDAEDLAELRCVARPLRRQCRHCPRRGHPLPCHLRRLRLQAIPFD